jgi:23S rRNA-/tRNA-specific pseudouridylate synthase
LHGDVYALIKPLDRQMLHARQLAFIHPTIGTSISFKAALPGDMMQFLEQLSYIAK